MGLAGGSGNACGAEAPLLVGAPVPGGPGLRLAMHVGRRRRYWWGFRDSDSPRRGRLGGNAQDAFLARMGVAGCGTRPEPHQ